MPTMKYYLIENMMGFERPIEEGTLPGLLSKKLEHERKPKTKKVDSSSGAFLVEATYYIVAKQDWDIHDCPHIPVDPF
jgi:hypothetical protein